MTHQGREFRGFLGSGAFSPNRLPTLLPWLLLALLVSYNLWASEVNGREGRMLVHGLSLAQSGHLVFLSLLAAPSGSAFPGAQHTDSTSVCSGCESQLCLLQLCDVRQDSQLLSACFLVCTMEMGTPAFRVDIQS